MRFLLTGSTGFIGSYLRSMLLQDGHDLLVVTRSPESYTSLQSTNQQFISWDTDLSVQMESVDVVIHMAGENIFGQRWTDSVKRAIRESRILSTRRLVNAMEKASKPPELLISASGVGYYGDGGNKILDESSPVGDDFLASVCSDWELEALAAERFGVRVVTPRFGLALQADGGILEKMKLPFLLFVGGPIGSGDQYLPWIHMRDLCRVILYPVGKPGLSGPLNACSPAPVTMSEFTGIMGKVLNRPSLIRIPEWLLKGVLGEAAGPVVGSLNVRPKKLLDAGFSFEFEDLEEALADLL
ncbi:MAG: TIGR01777 family oxidoreductase [Balneolaceae bacterium]